MRVDPITIEIVTGRVHEVTATMEHALYHAGYSPILRESRDGTAGITDARGRVLMIGGGLQYHSLPYEQAVACVRARFGDEGIRPGDTFVVNDPYKAGNSHVPDFVAVTPAFHENVLIGFGVSIAHKTDVGGLVPGSSSGASREIFHDGMLIPPVRYMTADGVNEAVEDIIRNNSRTPAAVIGDLRGQIGATRLAGKGLAALCDEYGRDCVVSVMQSILDLTARRLRAELAAFPDGEASAEGKLDHDGARFDTPVRIAARVKKTGDRLLIDLSGCDPQTLGPVNLTPWTAKAVSFLAILAATDPTIPVNSGLGDCVDFILPEGSTVNPRFPATMNSYFPTASLVHACVLSSLGQLNPKRAVAPSGLASGAIALGYARGRHGRPAVQYELSGAGLGGTAEHDGAPIVSPMNHFVAGAAVEVLESEYPVMVRRYDMWTDSAGAGRTRGGVGIVREYEMLDDCVMTLRASMHKYGAWGVRGGKPPAISRSVLDPGKPSQEILPSSGTRDLKPGSVLLFHRAGGAGYGSPLERDPDLVLRDVQDGYVSIEAARDVYGVAITEDMTRVDAGATRALRAGA